MILCPDADSKELVMLFHLRHVVDIKELVMLLHLRHVVDIKELMDVIIVDIFSLLSSAVTFTLHTITVVSGRSVSRL